MTDMKLANTNTQYGAVSKFLHWAIFLLFVCQFSMGWLMPDEEVHADGAAKQHVQEQRTESDLPHGSDSPDVKKTDAPQAGHHAPGEADKGETAPFDLKETHKSVGLIVLVLVLFRITWRISTRLPDWAETLTDREKTFSKILEKLLYLVMLLMPLSGFTMALAEGAGIRFFGLIDIPALPGSHEGLAMATHFIHVWTARLILVLVGTHVAWVLKHQFLQKDGLLYRMLPSRGAGDAGSSGEAQP